VGDSSTLVHLEAMRGIKEDYKIVAPKSGHSVTLRGRFWPTMGMPWARGEILDLVTGRVKTLKTSYRVSWLKGIQIRQLIGRDLICRLVWRSGWHISPVEEHTTRERRQDVNELQETIRDGTALVPAQVEQALVPVQMIHFEQSTAEQEPRASFVRSARRTNYPNYPQTTVRYARNLYPTLSAE
jgi:hypothetical protein